MAKSTCNITVGTYKVLNAWSILIGSEDCHTIEAYVGPAGPAVKQKLWKLHQLLLQPEHVLDVLTAKHALV